MTTKKVRRNSVTVVSTSRWVAYTTAGLATAAVAGSAQASIHYFDVADTPQSAAPGAFIDRSFALGTADSFTLRHRQFSGADTGDGFAGFVIFDNAGFNGSAAGDYRYPFKLAGGVNVSAQPFTGNATNGTGAKYFATLAFGAGYTNSQWLDPGTGFIGFRFDAGGGDQYGWVRVRMDSGSPLNSFTVLDYAYGDVGDMILTGQIPEPGSLGLLALGGIGLLAWRKRRAAASK